MTSHQPFHITKQNPPSVVQVSEGSSFGSFILSLSGSSLYEFIHFSATLGPSSSSWRAESLGDLEGLDISRFKS